MLEINPDILIWCREQVGLSFDSAYNCLKKKFNNAQWFSEEFFQDLELGNKEISYPRLRKIANFYDQSVNIFFFDEVPTIEPYDTNLRTLNSSIELSHQSYMECKRVLEKRKEFLKLCDNPITFQRVSGTPTEIANTLRSRLKIDQSFIATNSPSKSLKYYMEAIESLGILVFSTHTHHSYKIQLEEFRGMIIEKSEYPIIIINSSDKIEARIFTLLHELGHLYFGENEQFCDQFAANFLMPKELLLNHQIITNKITQSWTQSEITTLTNYFSVSYSSLIIRLSTFDLISKSDCDSLLRMFNEMAEKSRKKLKESTGGPNPFPKYVLRNSICLTKLAVKKYQQDQLGSGELERILNINFHKLDKIKNELNYV